jgi:hypothetical protein
MQLNNTFILRGEKELKLMNIYNGVLKDFIPSEVKPSYSLKMK